MLIHIFCEDEYVGRMSVINANPEVYIPIGGATTRITLYRITKSDIDKEIPIYSISRGWYNFLRSKR